MIRGMAISGMAVVVGGHHALVAGLTAVVELLTDPVPQLAQQRAGVLGRRGDAQHPAQQRDVAQVGRDGLGDARVLDLDGDRAPVERDRAVYLPDRGGGYRPRIPAGERAFRRCAEFFLYHRRSERRAHRRDAVLEASQGVADRGRQAVVDVAGHLADLHHHALHRPQGAGDVFGGPQREVLAQHAGAARPRPRTAAARWPRSGPRRARPAGASPERDQGAAARAGGAAGPGSRRPPLAAARSLMSFIRGAPCAFAG